MKDEYLRNKSTARTLLATIHSDAASYEDLLNHAPHIYNRASAEAPWLYDLREAHRKLREALQLAFKNASRVPV